MTTPEPSAVENIAQPERVSVRWWSVMALVGILLLGAYFRFTGLNWDANQHLHPDERFLTMVETAIMPVGTPDDLLGTPPTVQLQPWRSAAVNELPDCAAWGGYFDTACSPLNPHNRGHGFYVYGTLPLFLVRYAGEWLGRAGYDQIHLVGRAFSGIMDLGVVLLVYLIALRLYRRYGLALLAAGFAAFSVLPIQLSHYFTVDTFTNFFGMLALLFAVMLLPVRASEREGAGSWLTYVLFGLALGLAVASKVNAVFLAALLPAAVVVRYFSQTKEERSRLELIYLRNLLMAGVVSILIFRIFQPYAFVGPGLFGIKPNPLWIDNIRSLTAQSSGDVDFPPALQWARRPLTFSWQNMVLWGLGLPLGILAWGGFLWMGWRILRGEWRQHLLIWAWTGLYFAYQSFNWVRSMRYQMLVYPTLAIIAAWAGYHLWSRWRGSRAHPTSERRWVTQVGALVGILVLLATAAWAFAFTRIYTRPVTRVEASRWIYQNIPGPLNLHIETEDGLFNQPVAYRSGYLLLEGRPPLVMAFQPRAAGEIETVTFTGLVSPDGEPQPRLLRVFLSEEPNNAAPLAVAVLESEFRSSDDPRLVTYTLHFDTPAVLDPKKTYYLVADLMGSPAGLNVFGALSIQYSTPEGLKSQQLPNPVEALTAGRWYQVQVRPVETGLLREVALEHVVDWEATPDPKRLRISILDPLNGDAVLSQAEIRSTFLAEDDPRGERYVIPLLQPVAVTEGNSYTLRIEHADGLGALAITGNRSANESAWDDALPVGLDGLSVYDYDQGSLRADLNFEMYWDDNEEKLQRFLSILDQTDTIYISSNRQWGTTTRVPERYPLTSEYYRQLLGCPAEREITWCYSVAQPGTFQGALGFELAAVFQSDPNLGSLRFNTQFAEEAFTVYDAPKVLIFRKTADYDADRVRDILSAVDLSKVIHLTPRKATSFPGTLLLPTGRLAEQRAGGTWADLFPPESPLNRYPFLAVIAWYLVITLLGLVMLPFTLLVLRALPDSGFPFLRLVGMLVLSYLVWLLGSYKVPFLPLTISLVFLALVIANGLLAYRNRAYLARWLRERWRSVLTVELLVLVLFMVFLLVRFGNPDLWHPWKGGEKPMDFSYFNAVLKSTTFPPYDPWFAGGYINYYYYGFVLAGVPVKWLGIQPAVAYNLILPTFFSLLAAGAYSVGWNLYCAAQPIRGKVTRPSFGTPGMMERWGGAAAGLFTALAVTVVGNWGTVRMIWHGLQRLGGAGDQFLTAGWFTRMGWTFQGLWNMIAHGVKIPYGPGDWYWIPSRALPGWTITEFPAFTFLYGDPHAHLFALPLTVLALAWALSIVLGRWKWSSPWQFAGSFALGGLAIGALKPTNTWDWPTFLAIASAAVVYTVLRYGGSTLARVARLPLWALKSLAALAGVALLALLSQIFFLPYDAWYGQGYNRIVPWTGARSPFWSYLTHWGVFLFVIGSWMASETVDWMAETPLSKLGVLRRYAWELRFGGLLLAAALALLAVMKVQIGWVALPMMVWAGLLLLREGQPDAKRLVLFMTGTALFLTLFVEVMRLDGDLDRMNTVFKFYLQAWTLLAISAAAGLAWLLPRLSVSWSPGWQRAWVPILVMLVFGAVLYPLTAGRDKIMDRMSKQAPPSLNGMDYMAYSTFPAAEISMDLSQDYRAIQWMQRHVSGSPVIVEANLVEYNWGSRFTVYTGLPGVVGWNWHQCQQRAVTPSEWVTDRVTDVGIFYNTTNRSAVEKFLQQYPVEYIVVGQLERGTYSFVGLKKFNDWNGDLWREVYREEDTVIYQVARED